MNVWVVKCRATMKDRTTGWHWDKYLQCNDDRDEVYDDWGGPEWVQASYSKKLLREAVHRDDLVVCYQTDRKEILGFTRMASNGKEFDEGSGDFNCFDLVSPSEAFPLDQPVTIEELRYVDCSPKCFRPGTQGTLFPVSPADFDSMVSAVAAYLPHHQDELLAWLGDAGYGDGTLRHPVPLIEDEKLVVDAGCTPEDVNELLDRLEETVAGRSDVYVRREVRQMIRRDRPLIRALKEKYDYRCQFPGCDAEIPMRSGGSYCEVHHLRAVAQGGRARRVNLLVLCPNHHKMFDYGDVTITRSTPRHLEGRLNGAAFRIVR